MRSQLQSFDISSSQVLKISESDKLFYRFSHSLIAWSWLDQVWANCWSPFLGLVVGSLGKLNFADFVNFHLADVELSDFKLFERNMSVWHIEDTEWTGVATSLDERRILEVTSDNHENWSGSTSGKWKLSSSCTTTIRMYWHSGIIKQQITDPRPPASQTCIF